MYEQRYALALVTPPAVEPVSLARAKSHIRADDEAVDNILDGYIKAARQHLEMITNRAFVTQTWDMVLDDWPCNGVIELPRAPLASVTSVTVIDKDLNSVTLDANTYLVDTEPEPGRIVLVHGASWPSTTLRPTGGIRVRFTAGYGGADDVPESIKQAVLLLVGQWFEQAENVVVGSTAKELPFAVNALLAPYRVWM